jgi:hypothetical protein
VTVLEIEQLEQLDGIGNRADLALSPLDTRLEGDTLTARVHNIGNRPATNVRIVITRDGDVIAKKTIPRLEAPRDAKPSVIPLKHPLTQFFTATLRASCAPSWTQDLFGHRRGDWRHREGSALQEYEGTLSYAQVSIAAPEPKGN